MWPCHCHCAAWPGRGDPPGASAPTFLVGGVVPAQAPLAPVAPCRAPPAPHLEVVPRAEEEAAVLRGAGLANDVGDLVAAGGRAVLAPASSRGRPRCGCCTGHLRGHFAVPLPCRHPAVPVAIFPLQGGTQWVLLWPGSGPGSGPAAQPWGRQPCPTLAQDWGQREQSSKDWGELLPCTGQHWARGSHRCDEMWRPQHTAQAGRALCRQEAAVIARWERCCCCTPPLVPNPERELEALPHTWSCPGCRRQAGNLAELGAEGRVPAPAHSPTLVPLPRQHSPEPRQGPRMPGSAARTAAPCARCSVPPPRSGQCSRSGMGWTGYSAGPGGPAWLEEEQGRELERCHGRRCAGPWPRMWPLLLMPRAAAGVLACLRCGARDREKLPHLEEWLVAGDGSQHGPLSGTRGDAQEHNTSTAPWDPGRVNAYAGKTDCAGPGPRVWYTARKATRLGLPGGESPARPWEAQLVHGQPFPGSRAGRMNRTVWEGSFYK